MKLREDIIEELHKRGWTYKSSGAFLDDVLSVLMQMIADGHDVMLHGFGKFEIRKGVDQTITPYFLGKEIIVSAKNRVKFTPGKHLKNAVRTGKMEENK